MTYRILVGVRDGFLGEIGKEYFEAIHDTPEEAVAFYNLYRASASR